MAQQTSFDFFWESAIEPAISTCEKEADADFRNRTKLCKCELDSYRKELKKIYRRKREWLKTKYLPHESDPILDMHKLSAILCRSMIGLKLFKFNVEAAENAYDEVVNNKTLTQSNRIEWQVNNVYINYKLAFLVAEGIIYADLGFWLAKKMDELNKNDLDFLEKNKIYHIFSKKIENTKSLCEYRSADSHDDFFTSSVVALMKNDTLNRDFDYLQFAISMFQWQEYTKRQFLYTILQFEKYNVTIEDLI